MGLRDRIKHSDEPTDSSHEAAWANWLSDDFTPPQMPAQPTYQPPASATTRSAFSREQVARNSYGRRTYAAPPQPVQQSVPTPPPAPRQPAAPSAPVAPSHPMYGTAPPIPMPALDPAGEVTININLPKLQLPRIKHPREYRKHLPALPYKKLAVSGVVLVVVGAGGLTAFRAISGKYGQDVALGKNKDVTASAGSAAASAGALVPSAKPTYKPVVPKSKPQLADAPADSSAYDAGRGVYSFVDVFNGTQLTVSEQPLPSKYASGEAATAAIAKQMGAKQQVNTAHGTAYIVSATKGSGQTVVVSAGNLLLFIQTAFNHSVYDWNDYINTLE